MRSILSVESGRRRARRGGNLASPAQGREPSSDQPRLIRKRGLVDAADWVCDRQGQPCCPIWWPLRCETAHRWIVGGRAEKLSSSDEYCGGGDVMRRPVFLFRHLLFLAGLLLFLPISLAHAASAENRVALVIGQSAYRAVPALPNAENDGKRMAELLTNAGFEVTAAPDLSQNDMRQTISDFAAKVAASGPDTLALGVDAGHRLQIDGENYLVPVDVDPEREADIPLQAVPLNDVLNTLTSVPSRTRILLLDACRNNPFPPINNSARHWVAIVGAQT